ncbi:MAG TPA: hypothetical protein VFZ98_11115 [Vicinamibacterales bacterium]
MNLFTHLVRADVRQFRWAILLWLVLVTAETTLTAARPALLTDPRLYRNVSLILGLLELAHQLGMVLLAVVVVQAHPAVGTDAFWMTRPVPPRMLFLSKIVLIAALMIVIPCSARAALMLSIHVPAREALFISIDSAFERAAWLAVVIAGATVTLNLSRFALLCGSVFVLTVLSIAVSLMTARNAFSYEPPVMPQEPDPTQFVLLLLCVTGAALLLAGIQYRTRLRRVSVPAGAVTFVLAAFAIPHWPFPLLRAPSALPAWTSDPGTVQLSAPSPLIEMSPQAASMLEGGPALMIGSTRIVAGGLERGWVPRLQLLAASVALEAGRALQGRGGYQSMPQIEGSADNPERVVARQVLGVEHVLMFTQPVDKSVALALSANEIVPTLPAHGQYRGQFATYLTHWEVAKALPLRVGAMFREDNFRFAIEQVNVGPGEYLQVRGLEWNATASFDRKPRASYRFCVRNAQRSHAMFGSAQPLDGGVSLLPFVFAISGGSSESSEERLAQIDFSTSYGLQEQRIDWNPDWYATSELVILRVTEAGAVLRTLDIPQASLVPKR